MNDMLDHDRILGVSKLTSNDPAFIEKDWHAVQLMKTLNAFNDELSVQLIFCGGTSLSKGLRLIDRFSEDLDFILCPSEKISSDVRKSFAESLISHIASDPLFSIDDNGVDLRGSHRFFTVRVLYNIQFPHDFLRPYLLLDMTFANHRLPVHRQKITSIISEASKEPPETQIDCISPIETASDKISALTWRVVVRDRNSDKDDPTMVRHLHDLAALKQTLLEDGNVFLNLAQQSLQRDQERRGGEVIASMSVSDRLQKAFVLLSTDALYKEEYLQFVEDMSYAKNPISFEEALVSLKELIDFVDT